MVCLYALQTGAQEVWLLPTFSHAFGKDLAPFEDRLEMCRRLVAPLGGSAKVLDVERELEGRSYTVDTVRHLMARHPGTSFRWVVGSDILAELHLWKEPEVLQQLVDFRVVHRGGHPAPEGGVTFPELSSTAVRSALALGKDVRDLVPEAVLSFIEAQGLYRGTTP